MLLWRELHLNGICKHISVNIKYDILIDIWKRNIGRYIIFFKNDILIDICRIFSFFELYMKIFISENLAYIGRNIIFNIDIFIYRSIYFNIGQYMETYSNQICFHISAVIRPLHISVNISLKLKSLKYYIYG